MLVEKPCVTRVVPWADYMDEVSLVRLHADCDILSGIHKRTAGWHGRTIRGFPAVRLVGVEQARHLLMVPIRECERNLLVEMERRMRIVYDQRAPEPIRILTQVVRMVPICTCLVNL